MKAKGLKTRLCFALAVSVSGFCFQMPASSFQVFVSLRTPQKKLAQYGEIMKSSEMKMVSQKDLKETVLLKVNRSLPKDFKLKAKAIADEVLKQSDRYHMDPLFLLAVIQTESSFNPLSRGPVGELGLMQLRVSTAEWISRKYDLPFLGEKDLKNPLTNIQIGAAYLDYLRKKFEGSAQSYISAYNMGPRNVRRLAQEKIIPEIYSNKVIRHYVLIHELLAKKAAQSEGSSKVVAENKTSQIF
jgi:soluble lytic murein transglycosylase